MKIIADLEDKIQYLNEVYGFEAVVEVVKRDYPEIKWVPCNNCGSDLSPVNPEMQSCFLCGEGV